MGGEHELAVSVAAEQRRPGRNLGLLHCLRLVTESDRALRRLLVWGLALTTCLSSLVVLASTLQPAQLGALFDGGAGFSNRQRIIVIIGLGMTVVVVSTIQNFTVGHFVTMLTHRFRCQVFASAISSDLIAVDDVQSETLSTRIFLDIDTGVQGLFRTIPSMFRSALTGIVCFALMFTVSHSLSLIVLLICTVVTATLWGATRSCQSSLGEMLRDRGELMSYTLATLGSWIVWARSLSTPWMQRRYIERSDRFRGSSFRANCIQAFASQCVGLLLQVGQLGLLLWAFHLKAMGIITGGILITFLMYYAILIPEAATTVSTWQGYQEATAAWRRVLDTIDGCQSATERPRLSIESAYEATASLELRDVAVHVGDEQSGFSTMPVSASVVTGQILGIAGPSGAGKTSLLRGIAGLARISSGELLVRVPAARDVSLNICDFVEYVDQKVYLVPEDIWTNLGIARDASDGEFCRNEVRALLEQYGVGSPEQIDRIMDADDLRAVGLSRGEMQRIAWMRLFRTEKPVVLIDEPTASVDSGYEEFFIRAIAKLSERALVVVVTHSERLLASCDAVVALR